MESKIDRSKLEIVLLNVALIMVFVLVVRVIRVVWGCGGEIIRKLALHPFPISIFLFWWTLIIQPIIGLRMAFMGGLIELASLKLGIL